MILRDTGKSSTTTFHVHFSLTYHNGRWGVCSPLVRKAKGYSNERFVYYWRPSEGDRPVVDVSILGSANPNTGPTPEEIIEKPLELARIKYSGPFPIPSSSELEELVVKGIRELVSRLPGRFCPEPPVREAWIPSPGWDGKELIEISKEFTPARPSWWVGKFPLRGRLSGVRQRGFFASRYIPAWRLGLFSESDCESDWEKAGEEGLLPTKSFYLGHHRVEVESGSPPYLIIAISRRENGHEFAQALIHFFHPTRIRVGDTRSGEEVKATVSGTIFMCHWPLASVVD